MLNINGLEFDFNITSPKDVLKYKRAGERMEAAGALLAIPEVATDDPAFLDSYMEMLNAELHLYADFLDEVLGENAAQQLLGDNPGLDTIFEINDTMGAAMEAQGAAFGAKVKKYTPNRATRRQK